MRAHTAGQGRPNAVSMKGGKLPEEITNMMFSYCFNNLSNKDLWHFHTIQIQQCYDYFQNPKPKSENLNLALQ